MLVEKKHKSKFWLFYKIFFLCFSIICFILILLLFSYVKKYEKLKLNELESIEESVNKEKQILIDESIRESESIIEENNKKILLNIEKLKTLPNLPTKDEVLSFAKMYCLFTSGDLEGDKNGIKQILPYIWKDSEIYKMVVYFAYEYIEGVKVIHTLGDPPIINERIDDFQYISDDEFSVHVSMDKRMIDKDVEYLDHYENTMIFKYDVKDKKWKWYSNLV